MIKEHKDNAYLEQSQPLSSHLSYSSHFRSSAGVHTKLRSSASGRSHQCARRLRVASALATHGALYLADHCTQGQQPRRSCGRRAPGIFAKVRSHRAVSSAESSSYDLSRYTRTETAKICRSTQRLCAVIARSTLRSRNQNLKKISTASERSFKTVLESVLTSRIADFDRGGRHRCTARDITSMIIPCSR